MGRPVTLKKSQQQHNKKDKKNAVLFCLAQWGLGVIMAYASCCQGNSTPQDFKKLFDIHPLRKGSGLP